MLIIDIESCTGLVCQVMNLLADEEQFILRVYLRKYLIRVTV